MWLLTSEAIVNRKFADELVSGVVVMEREE